MSQAEIFLAKQDTSKLKKNITLEEVKDVIQKLSLKFNMDIMELVKKVASKQADGFSLNKNSPYAHLYIGNGYENVSIELMTLENETKIKAPKSFFVD